MRVMLLAAAGMFGAVPGLVALREGTPVPPGMRPLFVGGAQAIGILAVLALWVNKKKLERMSQYRVTRWAVGLGTAALASLVAYLSLSGYCIVTPPKPAHADYGPVYFPLWVDGPIGELVDGAGSRPAAVSRYGPAGMDDALSTMPGVIWLRALTTALLLVAYVTVFTNLTLASGIVGFHLRRSPESTRTPAVKGE